MRFVLTGILVVGIEQEWVEMRIEVDSKAERVKTLSGFAQAAVALLDPTVDGRGYALQGGLHFFEPGSKELMHRGRPAEEGDGLDVFEPLRSATRLAVQPQRFLLIIEGIALRAKLEPSIDLLQPLVDLLTVRQQLNVVDGVVDHALDQRARCRYGRVSIDRAIEPMVSESPIG